MTDRVAVRVTPDALRRVRAGHPWVFDRSVVSSRTGEPGDLAVIFDDRREFAAIGLFDPTSVIRVKVLHVGKPVTIDAQWFAARIARSFERRSALRDDPLTTGYRCVHGENDGLPGLVIDRYDRTYVVKIYSPMWVPHLGTVADALEALAAPAATVLRTSRTCRRADLGGLYDGAVLRGALASDRVQFLEHGLIFEADVVHGQKTGHFLDQRDNRARVGGVAHGAEVLDVFCSTGGFTVHAAAGGATHVHSVDLNASSVAAAQRNVALNRASGRIGATTHETTIGDAFVVLERFARSGRRFDVVVVDPPSFAPNQASVERALHAYRRLTDLAVSVVRPGGLLVQASCSSRVDADTFVDVVRRATVGAGRRVVDMERTGHPLDHPIGFPEGEYLKAVFARLDRGGPSEERHRRPK